MHVVSLVWARTPGGREAAVGLRSTRHFLSVARSRDHVVVKLDFSMRLTAFTESTCSKRSLTESQSYLLSPLQPTEFHVGRLLYRGVALSLIHI